MEHKRAATTAVQSLGLQPRLRARALVLVAADSILGNSLRTLIHLNENDVELKATIKEFLRGEDTGESSSCKADAHILLPHSLHIQGAHVANLASIASTQTIQVTLLCGYPA